jgi:hypothetical protein
MTQDLTPANILQKAARELTATGYVSVDDSALDQIPEHQKEAVEVRKRVMAMLEVAAAMPCSNTMVWGNTHHLLGPLLLGLPLTPLLGSEDEWAKEAKSLDNYPEEGPVYQNLRMDTVFMREDGTSFCTAHYVFTTPFGASFIAPNSKADMDFPYSMQSAVIVPIDDKYEAIDRNQPDPKIVFNKQQSDVEADPKVNTVDLKIG